MRKGEHGILVTFNEASAILKIPVGTLYRWSHEDNWIPFGTPRARYWRWEQDVLRSCNKRPPRERPSDQRLAG